MLNQNKIVISGKEYWIGLSTIHKLTNQPNKQMKLKISLERFTGEKSTDFYNFFRIEDEVN